MAISVEPGRCRLVVFLKEPRPGTVKTRLARDIGTIAAAKWYRHQCLSLIRKVCFDPRWDSFLAVSPAASLESRAWPAAVPRISQGSGNLGERITRVFRALPPGPAAIIGSDVPGITAATVSFAFKSLGRHDVVFGPSDDGGYWLVGLKRVQTVPPFLFADVRWSTRNALQDTLASFRHARVGFAASLRDVDTVNDFRVCRGWTGDRARRDQDLVTVQSSRFLRDRFPATVS